MSVCLRQYRALLERHRALEAEHERALAVVRAARAAVANPAWAGLCDEDVDLEEALQRFDVEDGACK